MRSTYNALRKVLVTIFGVFVVIIGIILLPLPGPGLLVIFAGLLILSSEFKSVKHHVDTLKAMAKKLKDDKLKKNKNDSSE